MLTEPELRQLIALLQKLEPGFYPIELFWQFARLMTAATIEFVPLRMNEGKVEVMLTRRPVDDKFWPGNLHIPGCIVRPTDTEEAVIKRICAKELSGTRLGEPSELHTQVRKTQRGNEMTKLFWVGVLGDSTDGEFYSVDNLPDDLLPAYPASIVQAADLFRGIGQT